MKKFKKSNFQFGTNASSQDSNRDGAMLPILAVVLIILFVAVSLGVDIARMHVTRSELRTASDAAARAGVEALGRLQSRQAAIDAAIATAAQNRVAGKSLTLLPSQIELGKSDQNADGSFSFDPDDNPINSMRVLASRDSGSADGSVNLLFGPLFGVTDFEPVQLSTAMRTDRDIALVLDVSGSMASGGRFEALSQGVNEFLNILDNSPQNETVSLTVYSTTDRKLVDMTQNTQAIRDAFAAESPGGRTAIGLGLRTGLDSVLNDVNNRPFALKSIVVMTDGRHNEGIAPDVVALDAAAAGITVHTLTFGSGANQALMQEVAALTGGDHRQADTNAELIEAFEEIARQLSVLLIE